jgi:hypothetical protein
MAIFIHPQRRTAGAADAAAFDEALQRLSKGEELKVQTRFCSIINITTPLDVVAERDLPTLTQLLVPFVFRFLTAKV